MNNITGTPTEILVDPITLEPVLEPSLSAEPSLVESPDEVNDVTTHIKHPDRYNILPYPERISLIEKSAIRKKAEAIFSKGVVASLVDAGPLGAAVDIYRRRQERKHRDETRVELVRQYGVSMTAFKKPVLSDGERLEAVQSYFGSQADIIREGELRLIRAREERNQLKATARPRESFDDDTPKSRRDSPQSSPHTTRRPAIESGSTPSRPNYRKVTPERTKLADSTSEHVRATDHRELGLMYIAGDLRKNKRQPPAMSPASLARKYVKYFHLDKAGLEAGLSEQEAERQAIEQVLPEATQDFLDMQAKGLVAETHISIDPNDPSHDTSTTGHKVIGTPDAIRAVLEDYRQNRSQ